MEGYDLVDVGRKEKFCINFKDSEEVVKKEMRVVERITERIWMGINKGRK